MKHISIYLASTFILIALVTGMGVGYALTPQYSLSMYDKNSMDLGRADKWVDLRYINAMIAPHRGAMLLAEEARQSKRSEIADLAKEILTNEPKLIDELYGWKKEWYKDVRPVSDPQVPRLGSYNDTFDLRFLNALIAHHEAGIEMTQDIRTKSSNSTILDNADVVENFLTTTKAGLSEWRSTWYSL
jgi:uncharacterized protein (DUF305 family)